MNVAFKQPAQPVRSLNSIAEALLLPTGIDGVYARTAIFEQVVDGLTALISRYREPNTEVLRFPPVMSRRQVEKSGYLKSFPHFLGCVSCLGGAEAEIESAVERSEAGEDWTPALAPADLVLSPAACYPVYPLVASRGHVPAGGPDLRRRLRLLPPRAVENARPAAIVPHARICLHRHARRRSTNSAERWMKRARRLCRPTGPELAHRLRQRSVLRPRRQADGDEPGRAGAEIRTAHSGALRRGADRLHELQLSPRPFRHDLEPARPKPAKWRIPAASPSASIGWRWRCSRPMASTCRIGRRACARRWRYEITAKRPSPRIRYRRDRRAAAVAGP